jgi:EAL domain-containing protein (putative c-di-GMP-specific phosphodiesterase class I)
MEGLDSISYWYRSGRFIPGILPIPAHALASSKYIDALSDLILNSRLPVGLVTLGIQTLPDSTLEESCKEGLLRMRRLGVLVHLLQFSGSVEQLHWAQELQMEGVHLDMALVRQQELPMELLSQLQRSRTQIYASNLTLVKDLENASLMQVDHCYGGLMMPPLSRHQMLQINDSRIAKAIFSLHPHPQPNQNGDK